MSVLGIDIHTEAAIFIIQLVVNQLERKSK